jgi:RNA polymerase sigma factor (sigma-70 family)
MHGVAFAEGPNYRAFTAVPPDHLYTQHADAIESVLAYTCRAQRMTADAGDEFASWARLRLLEDDCAILRKFKGLSSLRTYLVTVMQRLLLDWRISEWGKWRPTTDARRLGPVAVELERLVLRDSVEFEQAAQMLVSKGVAMSRDECDRIWSELPRRPRRQRASDRVLEEIPDPIESPDRVAEEQSRASEWRAKAALAEAIPSLGAEEQLIIRLRYQDGFTVARIAELLKEEQKPLYRRIEQILLRLRAALIAAGVTREDVRDLLGSPAVELEMVFPDAPAGKLKVGPSTSSSGGQA